MKRIKLKITGHSGSGLFSMGKIVMQALRNCGFYAVMDREYPSIIKGGYSCVNINFSQEKIYSLAENCDILVAIDQPNLLNYMQLIEKQGTMLFGFEASSATAKITEQAENQETNLINIQLLFNKLIYNLNSH